MVIKDYFKTPYFFAERVCRGHNHALIIDGEGGIGKSQMIKDVLKETDVPYTKITGFTTPKGFYEKMYQTQKSGAEVVWLDDVEGLIDDKTIQSLLKSALETDPKDRVMEWNSTAEADAPPRFRFKSRVILCLNKLPKDIHFRAVRDRCLHYTFRFTYEEKLRIMELIASTPEQIRAMEWIRENTSQATENLSLRLLFKVATLVGEPDWKHHAKHLVIEDEELALILRLEDEYETNKTKVRLFKQATGKSRATYYRLKKKCVSKSQ